MKQHLHNVVNKTKGMCLIMEVLCEIRKANVVVEGTSVFVVTSVKLQSGQVNLYTPHDENLSEIGFLCLSTFPMVLLVQKRYF